MHDAYLKAVEPKPVPRVHMDHVAPVRLSVAEAVEELVDELPRVGRIGFRELTADLVERIEVVVRFLAVLEMFKRGFIDLHQTATFGDISIIWLGLDGADRDDEESVLAGVDAYDG